MFSFFRKNKQPPLNAEGETKAERKRLDSYAKKAQSLLSLLVKSDVIEHESVQGFSDDYRIDISEYHCHLKNKPQLRKELRELIKEKFGTQKVKATDLYDFVYSIYINDQWKAIIQPGLYYDPHSSSYEDHYNHTLGRWEVGKPEVWLHTHIRDMDYAKEVITAENAVETVKNLRSVNHAFAKGNFLGGTAFENIPFELKHEIATYIPKTGNIPQRHTVADILTAREGRVKSATELKTRILASSNKTAVEKYTQRTDELSGTRGF